MGNEAADCPQLYR